jgi:hypothetical protein
MVDPIGGPPVNTDMSPLTATEQQNFIDAMMSKMALTKEQATQLMNNLDPSQVRTYIGLANGSDNITKEEAKQMWGLSDDEVNMIFGDNNSIGVFSNPFGEVFLQFLMLSYSMGIDIKKLMAQVMQQQLDLGLDAAKQRKEGATVQFALAMTAAVITVGLGGAHAMSAYNNKGQGQGSHWLGPMGATLFTQPITAGGEFGKALYEYDAAVNDAFGQQASSIYQQLVEQYQSLIDAQNQLNQGLEK